MDFEPQTQVYICVTGIDDHNKVICRSQDEIFSVMTRQGNVLGMTLNNSWMRLEGGYAFRCDHIDVSYERLNWADSILFKNGDSVSDNWVVGNITKVEWKNPDCSYVYFKIDYFMTYGYRIDWANCYGFVEREHVKNDWSAEDGNPLFSNMGPDEGFNVSPDTVVFSWSKSFTPERVVVSSPYDQSGKAVFDGSNRMGLYTSVQVKCMTSTEANNFFTAISESKEASINNVVSVYGIPLEWVPVMEGGQPLEQEFTIIPINKITNKSAGVYRNAKCYSSPFMKIRMFSSEGDVCDFTPQWFGNDIDEYTIKTLVSCAGGMFGSAKCTFFHKNGEFDWTVWNDFVVALDELPRCQWTADGFTDWYAVNGAQTNWKLFRGIVSSVPKIISGVATAGAGFANGSVSAGMTGLQQAGEGLLSLGDYTMEYHATLDQQVATGATVNGAGHFTSLGDIGAGHWGFKVVYYATQQYILNNIDSYFDRFGYRINKLKKLTPNARPYWTFIKTRDCHVKELGGLSYIAQKAINAVFDSGVTIWNRAQYIGGYVIGDFSKVSENRGIQGVEVEL